MSVLVHAEVDGDRLDDELVQESLLILIGGDETTRHVISGGVHQLLLHRDQWDRLAADPSLRPTAVEEMLRWVTPIKNMVRTATATSSSAASRSSRATSCCCSTRRPTATRTCSTTRSASTSRARPTSTWPSASAPTSASGASLARLEISVMLDELLARTPDLAVADPAADLIFRPANFVSGLETLPVTWSPTD